MATPSDSSFADLQKMMLALHPLGPMFGALNQQSQGTELALDDSNCEDPALERQIHAAYSYGHQLTLVMEALRVLLDAHKPELDKAQQSQLSAFWEMIDDIDGLRAKHRARQLRAGKRTIDAIAALADSDPEAYAKLLEHMRNVLPEPPNSAGNGKVA
ncbi:MAG: hypothetical protein ACFB3T_09610 [Geminicoccaceae bacterium]